MRRIKPALGALLSVLLVCFSLPAVRAFAKHRQRARITDSRDYSLFD